MATSVAFIGVGVNDSFLISFLLKPIFECYEMLLRLKSPGGRFVICNPTILVSVIPHSSWRQLVSASRRMWSFTGSLRKIIPLCPNRFYSTSSCNMLLNCLRVRHVEKVISWLLPAIWRCHWVFYVIYFLLDSVKVAPTLSFPLLCCNIFRLLEYYFFLIGIQITESQISHRQS